MLWVSDHYKYVDSYSAGIGFSRQNLTSTDVKFCRLKSIPESDVYRRQILSTKVDPRTVRVNSDQNKWVPCLQDNRGLTQQNADNDTLQSVVLHLFYNIIVGGHNLILHRT